MKSNYLLCDNELKHYRKLCADMKDLLVRENMFSLEADIKSFFTTEEMLERHNVSRKEFLKWYKNKGSSILQE